MKQILLILIFTFEVNASILKDLKQQELNKQKQKSNLEASLLEDSWINQIEINLDISKNKNSKLKTKSKKAFITFEQDIFKSGVIFHTIEKAKIEKNISTQNFNYELKSNKIIIYKIVLELKKIDLLILKQKYLIENKSLEIEKKQNQYLNYLIDIEALDSAIIEKNTLQNEIEDLHLLKNDYKEELKKHSSLSYKNIPILKLEVISLKKFLNNNQKLILNDLYSKISKIDAKITTSSYLPKLSIYSQIGYEDNDFANIEDDYYNNGVKLSIPLDYNMKKNKELSRLNYQISKLNNKRKKEDERNRFNTILTAIKFIENKIKNSKDSISKYTNIYELTFELYEGLLKTKQDLKTIENSLNSSKLDIKILNIDKQLKIYELHKILKD